MSDNASSAVSSQPIDLKKGRKERLIKFAIVSTVGLGINQFFVFIGLKLLGAVSEKDPLFSFTLFGFSIDIHQIVVSEFIAIIFVTLYNYIVNKIWTFKAIEQSAEFNTLLQFIKFALVGASGTVVNLTLVHLFAVIVGWNDYLATAIGFTVSVFTNFILNDIWTFNPRFAKKSKQESIVHELQDD